MNARNRVFMILGLLTIGSLIWYFATVRPSSDLQLIGTVDANEVIVSAKIPGRIQSLLVDEGQDVKAGQLIAVIESDDLQAARKAAEATAAGQTSHLSETVATERQTAGETTSATVNAEAQVNSAIAALAQAQANYMHQQADTSRGASYRGHQQRLVRGVTESAPQPSGVTIGSRVEREHVGNRGEPPAGP